MKIISNYILILICILAYSCNDSFLERTPTHDLNNNAYWNTANDLEVYNNSIYSLAGNTDDYLFYAGFGRDFGASSSRSCVAQEAQSDNFGSTSTEHVRYTTTAAGKEVVPNDPIVGGWKWGLLRSCNVFLKNYSKAVVDQKLKNQYAGEVFFFRAWFYLDKVQRYGDVPYVTIPLETSSPELYYPRNPRNQVMDSVLRDINKAIEYLPDSWESSKPDRINKWIALALKSRLCLYEATFRKYHNSGDYESYFNESIAASQALMGSGKFEIYNTGKPDIDYHTLFISINVSQNKEIIFARKYSAEAMWHRISRYNIELQSGATKDFVDDFLCLEADGTAKPIALSAVYNDDVIENVFDNRDPRLKQTVLDPREERAIAHTTIGYPRLIGMSGWTSTTGYHLIKYFLWEQAQVNSETTSAPIFRFAEVLLNYAEAKAELKTITHDDLDKTVNVIRNRAAMPALSLTPVMDPKYASEGLSALMIELRRERRIELSFEQLRYQDLMRWKKGSYLAKPVLGMRFEDSDKSTPRYANAKVSTVEVDGKKYIDVFAYTDFKNRVFDEEKHYLHPIPVNVLSKNPNLKQNPKWD